MRNLSFVLEIRFQNVNLLIANYSLDQNGSMKQLRQHASNFRRTTEFDFEFRQCTLKLRLAGKRNLPCDVRCVLCDEFCDDIDGRYGGRLIFDRIFTEDELRLLFEQLSPNDDGESFVFDDADAGFRYNRK